MLRLCSFNGAAVESSGRSGTRMFIFYAAILSVVVRKGHGGVIEAQ